MRYPRWEKTETGYEAQYPSFVRLHLYHQSLSDAIEKDGIVIKAEVRSSDVQEMKSIAVDLKNAADELSLWKSGMEDSWYESKIAPPEAP